MPVDASTAKAKLAAFKRRKKFSDAEWKKRGLLPSGAAVSVALETLFNELADRLATATGESEHLQVAESLLRQSLSAIDRDGYDTEEAEFVCAVFSILGGIFGLELSVSLNKWLYGEALAEETSTLADSPAATLAQPCTKCGATLKTVIMSTRQDIDFEQWLAMECASCGELNFLIVPPGTGSVRMIGHKMVAQYWRHQFNRQTAEAAFKEAHAKYAKKAIASKRRKAA